ncbi:hypothetical protein [Lysobacter gummosus]|uniref:hypothetical protein n=1 Tax=Lysobacter gummosus TaxID=262324 RepID=UPI003627BA9D
MDLPLPDGPSTATMLPLGTDRLIPRSTLRPPRSRRRSVRRTMGDDVVMRKDNPVRAGAKRVRLQNGAAWPSEAERGWSVAPLSQLSGLRPEMGRSEGRRSV